MGNRVPRSPRRRVTQSGPAAIDARGESQLTLEGHSYRLRPSRAAVSAIEAQTGTALLELVRLGNTGALPLDDLGIIAAEFIRAGADDTDEATKNVGAAKLADLIYEEGVMAAQAALTLVLLNAATGGRKVSGEAKAATA